MVVSVAHIFRIQALKYSSALQFALQSCPPLHLSVQLAVDAHARHSSTHMLCTELVLATHICICAAYAAAGSPAVASDRVSHDGTSTTLPACTDCRMTSLAAGCAPTTMQPGYAAFNTAAIPPIRPPPPTGTMHTSILPCDICCSSSTAIVPWPAMTCQSLYGLM